MKWKRTIIEEHTVYLSDCGRYAILKHKGYKLREREGGTDGAFWVSNDTAPFKLLSDAKAEGEKQEKVRLDIWDHFMKDGQQSHASDKKLLADPKLQAKCCGYSVDQAKNRVDWNVDQYTNYAYAYTKYRAFLRNDPSSYAWSSFTDPHARREWFKLVENPMDISTRRFLIEQNVTVGMTSIRDRQTDISTKIVETAKLPSVDEMALMTTEQFDSRISKLIYN